MKLDLFQIIVGLLLGGLLRTIGRTFLIDAINIFLSPLTTAMWEHARDWIKGLHSERNPLECRECSQRMFNLPK